MEKIDDTRRWQMALLIVPAILWGRLLFNSLWIDEAISYWSIRDGGLAEVISRVVHYQNQSPFYNIALWLWKQLVGRSEPALRLLSVLAAIGSCVALFLLARKVFGRGAAPAAVFFFAVSDEAVAAATNLRNYSFAMFFTILSTLLLVRWAEEDRRRFPVGYALSAALTVYAHFFFAAALLFQLAAFTCCAARRPLLRAKIPLLVLALLVAALCLLPDAEQLLLLKNRAAILTFAPMPGASDLFFAWFPPQLVLFCAAGGVAAWIASGRARPRLAASPAIVLVALWWLLPPLLCFLLSRLGGSSIFLSRYFSWGTPALGLLLAVLSGSFGSERARVFFMAAFALALLAGETKAYRGGEDWRAAAAEARRLSAQAPATIAAATGLVEAQDFGWLREPQKREYLLAPFSYYSLPVAAVPLPNECDTAEGSEYLASELTPQGEKTGRLIVIVRQTFVATTKGQIFSPAYYGACLERLGWFKESETAFEHVTVLTFSRSIVL